MTDQERQLIEGLASRIRNAPASEVDRDADAAIRTGIGSRPDALYILTQTVLVQEMALNQAKAQMDELKKRAEQPPEHAANFLGAQAPSQAAPPAPGQPSWWGRSAGAAPQQATAAAPPPLPPQYAPPQYAAPAPAGGGFSSFMKTAATTAAGVVAGEVAFSALSGLFGQHSGGGMGGGMMGGSGMGGSSFLGGGGSGVSPASETIVNNYYGDSAAQGKADAAADDSTSDDAGDNASDDSSDDSADDSSADDSSADDSGSYDDGGGGGGGDDS